MEEILAMRWLEAGWKCCGWGCSGGRRFGNIDLKRGGRAAERNVAVNLPLLNMDSDRVALEVTYGQVGESIHKYAFDLLEQLQ